MSKLILRNVSLELNDYKIVRKVAEENGFGAKGFSAALRFIIRTFDRNERIKITEAGLAALGEKEQVEVIQPEI
jgi:DNA polymerase/3'-5' exonuclease PolX